MTVREKSKKKAYILLDENICFIYNGIMNDQIDIKKRLESAPNVIVKSDDIEAINIVAVDSGIKHLIELKTKSWDY